MRYSFFARTTIEVMHWCHCNIQLLCHHYEWQNYAPMIQCVGKFQFYQSVYHAIWPSGTCFLTSILTMAFQTIPLRRGTIPDAAHVSCAHNDLVYEYIPYGSTLMRCPFFAGTTRGYALMSLKCSNSCFGTIMNGKNTHAWSSVSSKFQSYQSAYCAT